MHVCLLRWGLCTSGVSETRVTRQQASVFGFTAHDAAEPSRAGGLNCQHREVTSESCSRAATPDFRGNGGTAINKLDFNELYCKCNN